jgi:hypothetical protein
MATHSDPAIALRPFGILVVLDQILNFVGDTPVLEGHGGGSRRSLHTGPFGPQDRLSLVSGMLLRNASPFDAMSKSETSATVASAFSTPSKVRNAKVTVGRSSVLPGGVPSA